MKNKNILVFILTAALVCGCEGKIGDMTPITVKQLCIDWGSMRSEVSSSMGNQEAVEVDDILVYTDWNGFDVVIYQFKGAFLTSTVALLPSSDDDAEVIGKRYLPGYTHLGKRLAAEVYIKESLNTIATVYPFEVDGVSYTAIGWSMLTDR